MSYEEIIEERDSFRVKLVADEGTENPREDYEHSCGVVTLHNGYGHQRYIDTADPAGDDRIRDAWSRLSERYQWDEAGRMMERYIRILGGVSLWETPREGANNLWYILPEKFKEVQLTDTFDASRAMEMLRAERDEYRAWCEGDVWGYVVEKNVEWRRVDDDVETMETWEEVEDGSLWGMIGREYAEAEARMALSVELGETCEVDDCNYVPTPGTTRCAEHKEG